MSSGDKGVTRRHFVQHTAASASVAGLAGVIQAAQPPSANVTGANNRIRVACVGFADRFKGALLPAFQALKDEMNFDMVALADLWKLRQEEGKAYLEQKLGHAIDVYRSDEELYEKAANLDAVIISTADFQHAMHSIHAVRAGKDVYTEKPMAEDMRSANALLDIVKEARKANNRGGAIVQVGTQLRSRKQYQDVWNYMNSGEFGDIVYVDLCRNGNDNQRWRRGDLPSKLKHSDTDWQRWLLDRPKVAFDPRKYLEFRLFWPYSSGIPGQWMCHDIDTVIWLTGCSYPRWAMSGGNVYAWKDGRENSDTFSTIFEFGPADQPDKGFQVLFSSRMTNSARGSVYRFHSTAGTLDLAKGTLSDEGAVKPSEVKTRNLAEVTNLQNVANPGADNAVINHMRNWMECIRQRDGKLNAPVEAGYSHTITLVMANASMQTGMRSWFDPVTRQVMTGNQVFTGY